MKVSKFISSVSVRMKTPFVKQRNNRYALETIYTNFSLTEIGKVIVFNRTVLLKHSKVKFYSALLNRKKVLLEFVLKMLSTIKDSPLTVLTTLY